MKSKPNLCMMFVNGTPFTFNRSHTEFNHKLDKNLYFSAEFWQPFIDVEVFTNDTTRICGPLLGIILVFANKLGLSLVYKRTTTGEHKENFDMIRKHLSNLILCPFPPINAVFEGWDQLNLSRYIGDIAMVSILSSKTQIESIFHLLQVFDTNIWITLVVLYLFSSLINWCIEKDSSVFIEYFGVVFGQTVHHWKRNEKTSLITLVWMYGSLVIMWAYSGYLLTFLVFPTPYDKIDSIDDLIKSGINFGVFDDETAYEYVTDPNEEHFEEFKGRYTKERAANAGKEQWERRVFSGIANNTFALVSDQPFNDYHFATQLKTNPNLYRSKDNSLVVPYFIALSKSNSKSLNSVIDRIICSLSESGIYNTWVKHTLDVNNEAVRSGIVDLQQSEYEFLELGLETFKVFLYLAIITVILSFIAFATELIFKPKVICNKQLPKVGVSDSPALFVRRRHSRITYRRFDLITEYWVYGIHTYHSQYRK